MTCECVTSDNDVGAFLAVFAVSLLDNVLRLEDTVGRVTDFIMSSKPGRETVVTLQSFDLLKQEFEALGDALSRYAEAHNKVLLTGAARANLSRDVISGITVADLQERLLAGLEEDLSNVLVPEISPEQAAEVGIDVEY